MNKKTKTATNQATQTSGTTASTNNSTQSATGTSTSTPNAPSWVTGLSQSFADQIPNTNYQVAGLGGLQQDAVSALSGQNFGGLFGDAANILRGSAGYGPQQISAGDSSKGIGKFMNPYMAEVVQATGADLDYNDAGVRSQQALDLARNQAFGGSGAALTRSMTEGELARARATSLGNLRREGFSDAAALSQAEEARKLQAQIASAQAASASQANANAAAQGLLQIGNTGLNQQVGLGATQQATNQAQLNQPLTNLTSQIGLFGDLPSNLLTGQTNTTSGTVNQSGSQTGTMSGTSNSQGSGTETTSGLLALLEALPSAPTPA